MKAFLNDPKVKEKYLSRVILHREADEIIKGTYWEDGKGCAVGCTIHSDNHGDYETELGIPRILARLEDGIFESLPNDLAKTWPERFLSSINIGVDLESVWPKFAIWLLGDPEHGVIKYARPDGKIATQKIVDMYQEKLEGKEITSDEWGQALSAARYAADAADAADAAYAAYAAAAAADAAAADAAYAAAAAAAAAADAAYAAAAAAAAAADARTQSRIKQSEKLLELLREAKYRGQE